MSENKDDVLGPIRERDKREGFYVKVDDFLHENHGLAVMDRRSLLALVDSQRSSIESLVVELHSANLAYAQVQQDCHSLTEKALPNLRRELYAVRRELDAVRRDGERYRWLRKQMPADAITIESTRPRPATRSLHLSEDEADSAIDAAISEARGRE